MAINAAEMPALSDSSHIKSHHSQSTESSVISGLNSAFWPCFIHMGGVPGHPREGTQRKSRAAKTSLR